MILEHAILLSLDRVHPLLLPEQTLFIDVNLLLPQPATRTEFQNALAFADDHRWITGHMDELSRERRWKITAAGRATLAERS